MGSMQSCITVNLIKPHKERIYTMIKFLKAMLKHTPTICIISVILLLLSAAALIFWPEIIVLLLRYGFAVLNVFLAVWLIVSLIRSKL